MFFSIGLVLALAAVAAGSGYIVGREYEYEYDGYLYTGFPDKKAQFAVDAYKTRVTIQPRGGYAVYRIHDIKYETINEDIEDITNHKYNYKTMPDGDFFSKPFKVHYKHGRVMKFETSKDEPIVVTNVKRGLISLFNLNFDEAEVDHDEDHHEHNEPEDSDHYYKIYEDGVLGNCETQYVINHIPSHLAPQNNIVLNVTKSRNYHKCKSIPNHHYSTFYGHECGQSQHEKSHTLHGNAYSHYNIRGDRHHYVIETIQTEGELIYVPYPMEGQPTIVYTNRSVALLGISDVEHEIELTEELTTHDKLEFEIPFKPMFKEHIDLKKAHYLYHVYGKRAPMDEIKHLIDQLSKVPDGSHTAESNFPLLFLEVTRAFGTLSYSEIEELYHIYGDIAPEKLSEETVALRSLFFDILFNVGTNPSILFTKNMIHNKKIAAPLAMYFLQNLPTHVKELTESLLDKIEELCEDDAVVANHNTYSSCYLSLTTLIFDNCIAHYHPESGMPKDEHDCPEDIPRKYYKHIAQKLENAKDDFHRTLYLKAIGNLGVKEAFQLLKPHVDGHKKESLYMRNSALWALRNLGFRYPERLRRLIMPLYFDHNENYVIRLSSFILLLHSRVETSEFEAIARDLIHEEDDQVRSYVYSMFKSLANSTHPCYRQLSKDARYALHLLKLSHEDFEAYDYTYSHVNFFSGYDKDYDFGGSSMFAFLASDTGYVPKALYFAFNDFLGGKSYESLSFGLWQHGMERVNDMIYGPGRSIEKPSLFDFFSKRERRSTSAAEQLKADIAEKLHLPVRKYEEPLMREVFVNYMANSASFSFFNETYFADFLLNGALPIPNFPELLKNTPPFMYRRFTLPIDKMYYIASEVGIPILFDYRQAQYFSLKSNKLQLEVKPAFFQQDRSGPPTDIHLGMDAHFVFDKNLMASVGFQMPVEEAVLSSGINRRSAISLPIKLDVDVDLTHSKIHGKWQPVPHEIYHFHYEPYTAIYSYKKYTPANQQGTYKRMRRQTTRQKFSNRYFYDHLGVGFTTTKDFDSEWNDYGSWFHFMTQKSFREKFYYLYANPQLEPLHYTIEIEETEHDPTKEVDFTFSFDHTLKDEDRPKGQSPDESFQGFQHKFPKFHPTTHLTGEVVLKGPRERKARGEIIYDRDFSRMYNQLTVYYERTPFSRVENDGLKICMSGYMKYNKFDMLKFSSFETMGDDRNVEANAKIHLGKDCSPEHMISIHASAKASQEQMDLENLRDEPVTVEHHNPYAVLYQRCKKAKHDKLPFPKSCLEYLHLNLNLHHYDIDIKHKALDPRLVAKVEDAAGFFRHLYYDYSHNVPANSSIPMNEFHAQLEFSPIIPVANIKAKTRSRETHYHHVHVPHYSPMLASPSIEDIVTKMTLSELFCIVQVDTVYTFDGYAYEIPHSDCFKVIAKDTSPAEHFVVLAKIDVLKATLGDHLIEIHANHKTDPVVLIDNHPVTVTNEEPHVVFDTDGKEALFYISLRGFYYTIHSEKYGVIIGFFGRFVSLQVSPLYRARLTGLCGDYNGQKHGTYRDKDGCTVHDDNDYAHSMTLPTDTCAVPEVHRHCKGEDDTGCFEHKTKVIELENDAGEPLTCFSTEPIIECKSGCAAEGHVPKNMKFHCLPSKSEATLELLHAQRIRVLTEIRKKSVDHQENMEISEGCHHQ